MQGRTAADTDGGTGTGGTVTFCNNDTGGLTFQQLGRGCHGTFVELVGTYRSHRSGQVFLLYCTVTDYHYFLEHLCVILEDDNGRHLVGLEYECLVADERDFDHRGSRGYGKCEVTVHV